MNKQYNNFRIFFLCLIIAVQLPLVTYAEFGHGREYDEIFYSFFRFLAALIYSLGIIAFAWIKQKETLKWWTVFIFPLAFYVYWNFIKDIDVEQLRLHFKNIPENILSFRCLIYLILITGMCITLWLMIRYYREVIIKYIRK